MRIVLAAAIYPPEVGGPSFYAVALSEALKRAGHDVVVVTYGSLKFWPSGLRHILFAIKLLFSCKSADAIITFDTLSGGLPAAAVHLVVRSPLIVRIGGDFVWESYMERTKDLVPLPDFYLNKKRWSIKEGLVFAISRFVLSHANVVFSSSWQQDIWKNVYKINMRRATVIENAIEPKLASHIPKRKNFAFHSRPVLVKNIPAFKRAFDRVKEDISEIELETGTVPHGVLIERIQNCYAVVLPSISDITPNYILDALRCGKPFLLTKHSAYAQRYGAYGVIIDPLDEDDMVRGIKELADPGRYEELCLRIAQFNDVHSYDDIAREFISVITRASGLPR